MLSEEFMAQVLARSIDLEEDLCDQLFNHSEKRLARVLLKLARLQEADLTRDVSTPALSLQRWRKWWGLHDLASPIS